MFFKKINYALSIIILSSTFSVAYSDDSLFSTNLYKKFQAKSCTNCHDFNEKEKQGLSFSTHEKRRDVNRCTNCHTSEISGFTLAAEWFAMPGIYTSGMDAKSTCEKTKEALKAQFKSNDLLADQLEKHLLHDPRVLWGIEGVTPKSGKLPFNKKQNDMVKGGFEEWKMQVMSWIKGGMKCE
ncbi:MAG: hypothetical protein HQK79_07700 [Desulfobacterales bacterium]|nr:hypothetical protein [Desulfobacterales bacterium]